MPKYLNIALIALVAVLLAGCGDEPRTDSVLRVGVARFEAETARSKAQRTRGLLGRSNLEPDRAMVFVYVKPGPKCFHMRGMAFGLDIVWCLDGRVKSISRNVPPNCRDKNLLRSPGPVDLVAEIAAGQAEALGLRVGDTVKLHENAK
jgi:hypothetical protein